MVAPTKIKGIIETGSLFEENQQPIIRCSICTGEQVAGFRNRQTGKFEEIMLIKSEMDLKRFKEIYGVDEIRKEY